jgi:hypothetical protein
MSFLSWQERYFILSTDRIDWCPSSIYFNHFSPHMPFTSIISPRICLLILFESTVVIPPVRFIEESHAKENLTQGSMKLSKVINAML